jgi:hypothetical protein
LYNKGESFCIKGEKKMDTQFRGNLSLHTFVQGELAFMLGGLFVLPKCALCFALFDGVEPFCSP